MIEQMRQSSAHEQPKSAATCTWWAFTYLNCRPICHPVGGSSNLGLSLRRFDVWPAVGMPAGMRQQSLRVIKTHARRTCLGPKKQENAQESIAASAVAHNNNKACHQPCLCSTEGMHYCMPYSSQPHTQNSQAPAVDGVHEIRQHIIATAHYLFGTVAMP